jgi:hypothetical protein
LARDGISDEFDRPEADLLRDRIEKLIGGILKLNETRRQ